MEIRLVGTGGSGGWPEPGCPCASCARARLAGHGRAPAEAAVDGVLRVGSGGPPGPVAGAPGGPVPAGYRVDRVPGAWAVTSPGGARLLAADGSGAAPEPVAGGPPFDVALLDLLGNPAQLGALRRRGLVHPATVVAVWHVDHRVTSAEELARRCRFWEVAAPADGDVLAAGRGGGPPAERVPPRRVLVLGGARSGKSRHAELRLAGEPQVTYLAAGPYLPGAQPSQDRDWPERVAAHRSRRPAWWQTVESLDVATALRTGSGAFLFDGAGTWLAAVLDQCGAWTGRSPAGAQACIAAKVDELVDAWRHTRARVVAVSDEVGSSIHPPTRAGRLFRDQLGWLNQRLAAESDETVLMVAGLAQTLST